MRKGWQYVSIRLHSGLLKIFGAAFIDNLIRIAAFEASACERRVSDVERRRYFEMV